MRLGCVVFLVLSLPITAFAVEVPMERLVVADAEVSEVPRVDLNAATVSQLVQLPGVGEQRARSIVQYRTRTPFRRRIELMRVPGIGRRLYARLKPWVKVALPLEPLSERRTATN